MYRLVLVIALGLLCVLHPSKGQSDLNDLGTVTDQASPQPAVSTSVDSAAYRSCFTNCRTIPTYNPVCGSDGVSYDNEFKLQCARLCGIEVQVVRGGTCAAL
ncbi:uncharacterized protein LOC109541231 isoform X1 [Dendroctonus ponderosae]